MKQYIKKMTLVVLMSGSISNLYAGNSWWPSFSSPEKTWLYYRIGLDSNTDLKSFGGVLWDIAKDNQYYGIMLIIDNNGGSSARYSAIHDMVCRVKKIKPVVALITGNALSGGYWVASAADYVFAHSASGIGSIGVYQDIHRWSDTCVETDNYKASLTTYTFRAGKYKGLENPCTTDLSEDDKIYLQEQIEKIYKEFVAAVARNRGLDIARADEWADGKDFIASEALSLGLIDEIGTIFEAESKLVELMTKKYDNL